MLNRTKNGLQIFDNIWVDRNLKKYQQKDNNTAMDSGISGVTWTSNNGQVFSMPVSGAGIAGREFRSFEEEQVERPIEMSKIIWRRVFKWLFGWLAFKPKPKISVQQFFEHVKTNLKEPSIYVNRVNDYLELATTAKKNGQQALFEELSRDAQIVKQESLLLSSGFATCITEEQVVKFYKDSDKGLSLHFISNFGRLIPSEVAKKKEEADDLLVFDNYCILHYDPQQKAYKLTQQEIEKRRDPILFGLIAGQRKLYYIADWVDEYCDLTLQQFIEKFGKEAIEANNISVKYKK